MRPETAVAGERSTLSCISTSDFPTTLSWRGQNSSTGRVSPVVVDGMTYTTTLSFDSVKLSDSRVYECVSVINVSTTGNTTYGSILLQVEG